MRRTSSDHRDGIINDAEVKAETLVSDAEAERDRILRRRGTRPRPW